MSKNEFNQTWRSPAPRPNLARLTLEAWRSGPRWRSRLVGLAGHYAAQYQESPEAVYAAALALAFDGEVREG